MINEFAKMLAEFMKAAGSCFTGPASVWFEVNVRQPMLAIHASCVNKGGRP